MSTSTLGGFESEERKVLYNEYLFQRRVLFGITISIVFAAFIWTIAICTDHWIIVQGEKPIFIPISERFFLSSHTGLWRLCRYALTPILLTNSTLPQLITKIIETNTTEIMRLKKDIADDDYIDEYIKEFNTTLSQVHTVDNHFKHALFGHWVRETAEFPKFRAKYKSLAPAVMNATMAAAAKQNSKLKTTHYVITDDLAVIRDTFGVTPFSVRLNATARANVILPTHLKTALFDEWNNKSNVVRLLGKFARDMDLPLIVTNASGTRLAIKYPDPPVHATQNADYRYEKYENCKYHNFFPLTNETEYDPSIDEILLGDTNSNHTLEEYNLNTHKQHLETIQDLVRTQASFACIAMLIMSMAFVFSMYTFLNPRYMFKRLAGGIHFISALLCLMVLRISSYAVEHEQSHMEYLFPKGAEYSNGSGIYMGWFVFLINASACLLFLWYSKKKKGNKAATEELAMADEPINMGR